MESIFGVDHIYKMRGQLIKQLRYKRISYDVWEEVADSIIFEVRLTVLSNVMRRTWSQLVNDGSLHRQSMYIWRG